MSCQKNNEMNGSGKIMPIGSRAQVFNGSAKKTAGGLKKSDLFKDDAGRIRSKKASEAAKKRIAAKGHGFKKYVDEAKKNKGKKFKKMQKIVKTSSKKKDLKVNKQKGKGAALLANAAKLYLTNKIANKLNDNPTIPGYKLPERNILGNGKKKNIKVNKQNGKGGLLTQAELKWGEKLRSKHKFPGYVPPMDGTGKLKKK